MPSSLCDAFPLGYGSGPLSFLTIDSKFDPSFSGLLPDIPVIYTGQAIYIHYGVSPHTR